MVTEFCDGGDLQIFNSKNSKQGIFSESDVKTLALKLAQGLQYLHSQEIVHRDIKPENILCGVDNNWKLCDFGSCTTVTYA